MSCVELCMSLSWLNLLLAYRDELRLPRHSDNYTYIRHTRARANETCQAEKPFDLQNWNCDTCSGPGAQQCNSSDCSEHCFGPAKQCFHANRFLGEVSYFRTYTHCGEGMGPPWFSLVFHFLRGNLPISPWTWHPQVRYKLGCCCDPSTVPALDTFKCRVGAKHNGSCRWESGWALKSHQSIAVESRRCSMLRTPSSVDLITDRMLVHLPSSHLVRVWACIIHCHSILRSAARRSAMQNTPCHRPFAEMGAANPAMAGRCNVVQAGPCQCVAKRVWSGGLAA